MELKDYIDRIKFQITGGGVLQSELSDKQYGIIVNNTIREINNYYNVAELIQVDSSECIDLTNYPQINNVVAVHRTSASGSSQATSSSTTSDPSYLSYMQMYNLGSPYSFSNDYMYRLVNYSTTQSLTNAMSTDLDFRYDEKSKKLYVNYSQGMPSQVVIEYIPKLNDASDVLTQHWQDILYRLSLAEAKIAIGRIRTRFRQTSALYEDDGDTILAEGRDEATEIRDRLKANADLLLPLD